MAFTTTINITNNFGTEVLEIYNLMKSNADMQVNVVGFQDIGTGHYILQSSETGANNGTIMFTAAQRGEWPCNLQFQAQPPGASSSVTFIYTVAAGEYNAECTVQQEGSLGPNVEITAPQPQVQEGGTSANAQIRFANK